MTDFPNLSARLAPAEVIFEPRDNGEFVLRSPQPLQPYERCIGEWLERWACERPDQVYLAERHNGGWHRMTYREVRQRVGSLAQGLLDLDISAGRPLLNLSDIDVDQALLSLAAMHVGIPVATTSVAYSRSTGDGCSKLKAIIEVLYPAVIFVSDGDAYYRALQLVKPDCLVVAARNAQEYPGAW